jgi:hypothetical protein
MRIIKILRVVITKRSNRKKKPNRENHIRSIFSNETQHEWKTYNSQHYNYNVLNIPFRWHLLLIVGYAGVPCLFANGALFIQSILILLGLLKTAARMAYKWCMDCTKGQAVFLLPVKCLWLQLGPHCFGGFLCGSSRLLAQAPFSIKNRFRYSMFSLFNAFVVSIVSTGPSLWILLDVCINRTIM